MMLLRQVVARERHVQLGDELPNLIGGDPYTLNREIHPLRRRSSLAGTSCEGSATVRRRQLAGVPFSDDYRVEIIGRAWATARRSR